MSTLIITIHVLVCLGLIAIILLQAGRGAGLANIFGGGSSGLFTPSTGGPIAKLTAVLAAIFLITSLYLSLSTKTARPSSLIQKTLSQEETAAPQETPASPESLPAEQQ
jgi:preprotein translocase subunit SecG